MFNISLPINGIDFKTLEKEIHQKVLKYGRELVKSILEKLDRLTAYTIFVNIDIEN